MNGLTAEYEFSDGILTVYLIGEIDHHTVKSIRDEIDRQMTLMRARCVHFDLSGVGFMDSSGLGLIVGRYEKAKKLGLEFYVANPVKSAERIMQLSGADKMIKTVRTDKSKKGI